MQKIFFSIIVAVDQDFGIGKDGRLPWHLAGDMKYFKDVTTTTADPAKQNAVVMGRKTWEALPEPFRPLPRRRNVVLSRNADLTLPEGVTLSAGLDQALHDLGPLVGQEVEQVFVIGGEQIFQESITHPSCEKVYLTQIFQTFPCDTHFPRDLSAFRKVAETPPTTEGTTSYSFCEYVRQA